MAIGSIKPTIPAIRKTGSKTDIAGALANLQDQLDILSQQLASIMPDVAALRLKTPAQPKAVAPGTIETELIWGVSHWRIPITVTAADNTVATSYYVVEVRTYSAEDDTTFLTNWIPHGTIPARAATTFNTNWSPQDWDITYAKVRVAGVSKDGVYGAWRESGFIEIPAASGLQVDLNDTEVRIMNEHDPGLDDYGVLVRRKSAPERRTFITPNGVFLHDEVGNLRGYFSGNTAGGSYLGLYDSAGYVKATLFVMNDVNRSTRLVLDGQGSYVQINGYVVLRERQTSPGVPSYYISSTAGSTYGSTEQAMLNNLKNAMNSVGTVLSNLLVKLGPLGHGLIETD